MVGKMGSPGNKNDGHIRHFVGRTQGMLRSGILSVIEGGSDIFSGISSKLESALSMSLDSSSVPSEAPIATPSKDSVCDVSLHGDRELRATGPDPYEKLHYRIEAGSSESGSSKAGYGPSTSLELSGPWRSGSEGSVSSLSADGQNEESETISFMKCFVDALFEDVNSLSLEDKAAFGKHVQTEQGRTWFARLINARRNGSKCVSEETFYGLVQHFAIVLFECADADHFSPAKTLMNMCFTFYHEVEVPGCEPFKEYLSAYLKDQPIWQSLRFWNAAFFDALQCERLHRPVVTREEIRQNRLEAIADEKRYQENITFGQLGTFTCNMHAFGLEKELCCEFLRKQCSIAALAPDQEKMLRDNVQRMYEQTDPWR